MKSKIKLFTSSIDDDNLESIERDGYLPVFAIRNISRFSSIKRYSNTAVHFRNLAPSEKLMIDFKNNIINSKDFEKLYVIELSNVSIQDIIKKFEYLSESNNKKGVVIMTEDEGSYSTALSLVLKCSGYLIEPITKYDI